MLHLKCVIDGLLYFLIFNQSLYENNIPFIVSPYEADAEIAYLIRNKIIDIVLTEDSDTIPYLCPHVFFKLGTDYFVDEYKKSDIINSDLSIKDFTNDQIIYACILSGCDYAVSPPGIGFKTAIKIVKQYRTKENIFDFLRIKYNCQDSYFKSFENAEFTFKHQYVIDPKTFVFLIFSQEVVPLTPIPKDVEIPSFIGKYLSSDIAKQIATCKINPITKMPFKYTYDEKEDNTKKISTIQTTINFTPIKPKNESVELNNSNKISSTQSFINQNVEDQNIASNNTISNSTTQNSTKSNKPSSHNSTQSTTTYNSTPSTKSYNPIQSTTAYNSTPYKPVQSYKSSSYNPTSFKSTYKSKSYNTTSIIQNQFIQDYEEPIKRQYIEEEVEEEEDDGILHDLSELTSVKKEKKVITSPYFNKKQTQTHRTPIIPPPKLYSYKAERDYSTYTNNKTQHKVVSKYFSGFNCKIPFQSDLIGKLYAFPKKNE